MHDQKLIRTLFDEAEAQPSVRRREVIEHRCAEMGIDDPSLTDEVLGILGQSSTVNSALRTPYFAKLAIGTLLNGRFRIIRELGSGGMGTVYEAEDVELKMPVALKTIRPEFKLEKRMLEFFRNEVRLAKKLSHPNICRIYDIDSYIDGDQEVHFFTMELHHGETIQQYVAKRPFPHSEALPLIRQIARALDYAHNEGVIHRDLKPNNIVLVPEINGRPKAIVLDFGVALDLAKVGHDGLNIEGERLGADDYIAPEQRAGQEVGKTADVFALGLIAHKMVTGKLPPKDSGRPEAVGRHLLNPLRGLMHPPDALWTWAIRKCLEQEPSKRWQAASSFARALAFPVWSVVLTCAAAMGLLTAHYVGASVKPQHYVRDMAVLPFDGPSGESKDLASVVGEALGRRLNKSRDLRVVYGASAQKPKPDEGLDSIASRMGVSLLLEGRADVVGDDFDLTIMLDDAAAKRAVWTGHYKTARAGLLALAEPIYRDLATALGIAADPPEQIPNYDADAYEGYLKGRKLVGEAKSANDLEKALSEFKAALKKDPRFAAAEAATAATYLALYRRTNDSTYTALATQAVNRAQSLGESPRETYLALGNLYSTEGKYDEAISIYQKAIDIDPKSDEGYRGLGRTYLRQGKKEACLKADAQAVALRPNYFTGYYQLGKAYYSFGENAKALEAYRRVTELAPRSALGWEGLGHIALKVGRYQDASRYYQQALDHEKYPGTYSNLGTTYFYLGDYGKAIANYKEAIKGGLDESSYWGNLGDAYRARKNYKDAKAAYTEAIAQAYKSLDVNKNDPLKIGELALYYARTNDSAQALEKIRQARQMDSANADLSYFEAIVETLAHRDQDAFSALKIALGKGNSVEQVRHEPDFKDLLARPAVQQLLKSFESFTPAAR